MRGFECTETDSGTLHQDQDELDQNQVLSDVMVIADEADAQLAEAVHTLMEKGYAAA
jgi:hypothetical protein